MWVFIGRKLIKHESYQSQLYTSKKVYFSCFIQVITSADGVLLSRPGGLCVSRTGFLFLVCLMILYQRDQSRRQQTGSQQFNILGAYLGTEQRRVAP